MTGYKTERVRKIRTKTKIIAIVAATVILSFTAAQLYAVPENKIFTSSGQILDGEEWNNVSIYNDATIVDMLGGNVDSISTFDASTISVTGGQVNMLGVGRLSTAHVSGGFVYGLDAWDQSSVIFSEDADVFAPRVCNFANLTMNDGTVNHLGAIDAGIINLYGGLISDYLVALDYSVVNIFGYDLLKTNTGGKYAYGQVYGFWTDGTAFTIDLNGSETYSHINLIPEPTSLLLFGLGALLLRKLR